MQRNCDVVKLGQRGGWCGPLHALSIVCHAAHVSKPPLHLPEVGLDLVALIVAHDDVHSPHPPALDAS